MANSISGKFRVLSATMSLGLIAIGGVVSVSAFASDADQFGQSVTESQATQAIQEHYAGAPSDLGGVRVFTVRLPGLDEHGQVSCKQQVAYSDPDRQAIQASKAYQMVEANCISYNRQGLQRAIKMGMVDKSQPSPYVTRFQVTAKGKKHMHGKNGYYQVLFAHRTVDHVLKIDKRENQYRVPVADVRYSLVSAVDDWAKPFVGPDKAIRKPNYETTNHTARFWKTDNGWQLFYVTLR